MTLVAQWGLTSSEHACTYTYTHARYYDDGKPQERGTPLKQRLKMRRKKGHCFGYPLTISTENSANTLSSCKTIRGKKNVTKRRL